MLEAKTYPISASRRRLHLLAAGLAPLVAIFSVFPAEGSASGSVSFSANASNFIAWKPFFRGSVGSGHMALAQRQDYRQHLAMVSEELGMIYIRGHGLFDDDMSVFKQPGQFAFYNIFSHIDNLLSIGMLPILELSFVPEWLASTNHTITHYKGYASPPNDLDAWQDLHLKLGKAIVQRYGEDQASKFYFEVWNEPNDNFLDGSEEDYFEMYQRAAWGLKNASAVLRVGGPATNSPTKWLADFLQFTKSTGTPFDFVSSHAYSGCGTNVGGVDRVVEGLKDARAILGPDVTYLVTEYGAACTQGIGLPTDAPGSAYHDTVDQAAYVAAVVTRVTHEMEHPPDALSYWAFSDVFEENFFPVARCTFHGGFGLVAMGCGGNRNVPGIPKPTYRAYQILNEAGDLTAEVQGPVPPPYKPSGCNQHPGQDYPTATVIGTTNDTTAEACCSACIALQGCSHWSVSTVQGLDHCWLKSDDKGGLHPNPGRISGDVPATPSAQLCPSTTGVLVTGNKTALGLQQLDITVYNHATQGDPITDCNVTVSVGGVSGLLRGTQPQVRRIDSQHANPLALFQLMGLPNYTTPQQDDKLLAASQLVWEEQGASWDADQATVTVQVPAHGMANVRFGKTGR